MSRIHPSAIISPQANIDSSVEIGPFCIIDGPVQIGPDTRLLNNVHISGHTIIGSDNEIHMGAVIGHIPQHKGYKNADSGLIIGNGNIIREYVSIHRAYHPGENTILGDENFLMGFSHVGHDCKLGNRIILANGSLLAGHTQVDDAANISGNVAIHQFVRIGTLAMIGGMARITKDVPPYMLAEGDTTIRGINAIGLRRAGFELNDRTKIKDAYRILYRKGLNVPQAMDALEPLAESSNAVKVLTTFIQKSVRGICRHAPISSSEFSADED